MTTTSRLAALAAVLTLSISAASVSAASAATWCVGSPSCEAAGGTAQPDLSAALAASTTGTNTIQLGPGTYTAPDANGFHYVAGAGASVHLIGAGQGVTVLAPSAVSSTYQTTLDVAGNTTPRTLVSGLTVQRGNASIGAYAIKLQEADAASVTATSLTPAAGGEGINAYSGVSNLTDCTIDGGGATAVFASTAGAAASVDRCTLTGSYGAYANPGTALTVQHSTLRALTSGGVYGYGTMRVSNSLVLVDGASAAGLQANSSTGSGELIASDVTVVGHGTHAIGAKTDATVGAAGTTAKVFLDSVTITGVETSLKTIQGASSAASIDVTYTNFAAAKTSGSSMTLHAGNLDSIDPHFVDPAHGDYHLAVGSPLIDRGDPAPILYLIPPLDRDGRARYRDATRDMGAFEYQHLAPIALAQPPAPAAPEVGTPSVFDGSSSTDPDPGDTLTYAWAFDDGATASTAIASHAFAVAGPHTATLTVTDPTGLSSSVNVSLTAVGVVKPPPKKDTISIRSSKVTLSATGKVAVSLRCDGGTPGSCEGTLTLTAKLPKAKTKSKSTHAAAKAVKIGSAKYKITLGRTKSISVTLSTAARHALASHDHITASVNAATTKPAAASTTKSLKIVPAPKKHAKAKKH